MVVGDGGSTTGAPLMMEITMTTKGLKMFEENG